MTETWDRFYVIIHHHNKRMTVKVEQYASIGENSRKFVRIYGPNFNHREPASQQLFGFGPTLEKAVDKFINSMERVIW